MDSTSTTLLDRLRQSGPSPDWDRFVRLYSPLLLAWARRQGFQDADARDLVQDVLTKLLGVLPDYRRGPGQSFRSWLARVAANQGRDFRRRRATRALPAADGLSGLDDAPTADFEEVEYRRALVNRGLDLIRPDFEPNTWAAFTGMMVDGRPVPEVAAQLGVTPNAVYLARHRVLTRLREELDGLLD